MKFSMSMLINVFCLFIKNLCSLSKEALHFVCQAIIVTQITYAASAFSLFLFVLKKK